MLIKSHFGCPLRLSIFMEFIGWMLYRKTWIKKNLSFSEMLKRSIQKMRSGKYTIRGGRLWCWHVIWCWHIIYVLWNYKKIITNRFIQVYMLLISLLLWHIKPWECCEKNKLMQSIASYNPGHNILDLCIMVVQLQLATSRVELSIECNQLVIQFLITVQQLKT